MSLSLHQYLAREEALHGLDPVLTRLLTSVSEACKAISFKVRNGALAGVLGAAGTSNVQGEDQKKLDVISNDIFGQNIASSARFADDFGDDGEFVKRIKEYFYNIILPYSPMVLKTLPVVEKLDIDMIAPDHGLIHRGEKAVCFIIDMYRNLAEQKPQQRALIFYDTMWQSTERMAYAACSGLEENGVPPRIMSVKHNHHSAVMTELADCGAVLAGSPTHNNTVLPLVAAQLTYMKGLRPLNRVGGAFGSYGWSGEAPKYLQEQLAAMNMTCPPIP